MSASLPGRRELPASQYDLSTYSGRVRQAATISDPRTLFVSASGLENAKRLITRYKRHEIQEMTPELWQAKRIVDATLHPDTGLPIFLPFRMSCFVISNLIVTGGMLQPKLSTRATLAWQITNQSLNVGINSANANKSSPITTTQLIRSYLLAVGASCGVAVGLRALVPRLTGLSGGARVVLGRLVPFAAVASAGVLNCFLMRAGEIRDGIDVFPISPPSTSSTPSPLQPVSLGKSPNAALIAVSETAVSRVLNSTPIMVIPPLILIRLQAQAWLQRRPRLVMPVNLGLILLTSLGALPLALGAFPQRQRVRAARLEGWVGERLGERLEGEREGEVEFNRGI